MLGFLTHYDVILCPVDPRPAWPRGYAARDDVPPEAIASYTNPYSMAGWPAVVVRAGGTAKGLPIGVQMVAGPWRGDVALAVAGYLKESLGGWRPSDHLDFF